MTPKTPNSAQSTVEIRVNQALQYIKENPDAKFAKVARDFRPQRRFNGIPAKTGRQVVNNKLSPEEEIAICRYIDCLDNAIFAVRPEFIKDAANHILKERSSATQDQIPNVGQNWTSRFITRHG